MAGGIALEHFVVAAEVYRHRDNGSDHGDVDQQVLDDGDHGRRAQAGRVSEGGEDDEGDDQRQVTAGPLVSSPMAPITTWMPTSCNAMYGMVARMPVQAIASASQRLPKRPRTKSAEVT